MKKRGFIRPIIVCISVVCAIVLFGTIHCGSTLEGLSLSDAQAAAGEKVTVYSFSFADLAETMKPAVVNISTTKSVDWRVRPGRLTFSGIAI